MSKSAILIHSVRPKGSRKKGKKNRKHGRNKKKGEAYLRAGKHVRSHVKRIRRHVSRNPRDAQAFEALGRYESLEFTERVRIR